MGSERENPLSLAFQQKRHGHGEPNRDGNSTNGLSAQFLGEGGAAIPARNRSDRHHRRVRPRDRTGSHEVHRRDPIDTESEKILEAVHFIDVRQMEEAEHRKHENADPRPEIAAVNGDGELKKRGACPPPSRIVVGAIREQKTLQRLLDSKQKRGRKNQVRDKL